MKRIADHFGIKYYRRRAELASDDTTNDEFALDFIENVSCDYLHQYLATSPLLKPETIRKFHDKSFVCNTLISVEHIRLRPYIRAVG